MSDRVRIKFVRPYSAYRRGSVIEMDRGPAKSLLIAGIATLEQQPQLLETTMAEPAEIRTADVPRRRRK